MLGTRWWTVGVVLFCEGWAVGGVEEVCDGVLVCWLFWVQLLLLMGRPLVFQLPQVCQVLQFQALCFEELVWGC